MSHLARRLVIIGAGGRDFHNFNVVYRDNPEYRVVAFVTTQIPGITGRRYPPSLAGSLYPSGIPIVSASRLKDLVEWNNVDEVVLSFSDLTYNDLGRLLSEALATGASFKILGPKETMLESSKPVIAVVGVRTGAGKSSVSREVARSIINRNLRVGIVRHPMAYGDLEKSIIQKFTSVQDFDKYDVTIEEREEYEHYINMGLTVYAGVDYGKLLQLVESESDVILWDGGNNDWPFYRPDYLITVADAMRPGQEISSYPGEVNVRMADAVIVNKIDQASERDVNEVVRNIREVNPQASISLAVSEVSVDRPEAIRGRRVVVVEDSPTITHGGSPYAAGYVAALKYGAAEVVDPRPYAVGIIAEAYRRYPHLSKVVPSMGYRKEQLMDLEETLRKIPADTIVLGTQSDISKIIKVDKEFAKTFFRVKIVEGPSIDELVDRFLKKAKQKL
ncbi:MAG: cyclic 2,3-diphosphoglycerate synthase [Desulfurococcaceae archaeon]